MKIIYTHIDEDKNFFYYEPDNYDIIISNPPFSQKDDILKRLYELNKPYAMLLPIPSLQGQARMVRPSKSNGLPVDKEERAKALEGQYLFSRALEPDEAYLDEENGVLTIFEKSFKPHLEVLMKSSRRVDLNSSNIRS